VDSKHRFLTEKLSVWHRGNLDRTGLVTREVTASKYSILALTNHPDQLSLATPPWYYSSNFVSGYYFHFQSSSPVIFGFRDVANRHFFCVVLALPVADLYTAR